MEARRPRVTMSPQAQDLRLGTGDGEAFAIGLHPDGIVDGCGDQNPLRPAGHLLFGEVPGVHPVLAKQGRIRAVEVMEVHVQPRVERQRDSDAFLLGRDLERVLRNIRVGVLHGQ